MVNVSIGLVLIASLLAPSVGPLDPVDVPPTGHSINDDADPVGTLKSDGPDKGKHDPGKQDRQGGGNGGSSSSG